MVIGEIQMNRVFNFLKGTIFLKLKTFAVLFFTTELAEFGNYLRVDLFGRSSGVQMMRKI